MPRLVVRVIIALLTFAVGTAAVSFWVAPRWQTPPHAEHPRAEQTLPPPPVPEAQPTPDSPIRSIDFSNFTYPLAGDYAPSRGTQTFTLKDGKFEESDIRAGRPDGGIGMYMGGVVYGDVTGDGAEEALVRLGVGTGGSAIPHCVYVYTLKNGRPKLLWAFTTGDRADGGLRRMYAEGGLLVLELYGKGTRVGGELYGTEELVPACCANSVTRTRYVWRGGKFRQQGESEIFPNPARHSSYVR